MTTRYALKVKAIDAPPTSDGGVGVNPAMRHRQTDVDLDQGRAWSGDFYAEGSVSDPADAFAHFAQDEDTEAWLDKNEDGTLVGWVREGADVWRYPDVDAWALDVDGSQMQRADTNGTPDDLGEEPLADDGVEDPEAFEDEADPATEEVDPTDAVEDPTDLPEEDPDGEAADFDNPFADDEDDPEGDAEEGNEPAEDAPPTEDPAADDTDAAPDQELDPAEEGDELDPAADDANDEDDPDEDDEDDVTEADRLFVGGQKKHMPGEHNQESHGNWTNGIANGPDRDRGTSSSPKGAGRRPKGPAPEKASVSPDTIAKMSDDELAALMDSDDLYDDAAMWAAAEEMDSRQPLDSTVRNALGDSPTPAEKAGAFDAVIPEEWSQWVATAKKPSGGRSKKAQMQAAYDGFVHDQWLRAEEATKGNLWNNAASSAERRPFGVEAFFDGRANRAQVRKYASEELLRFFADDPRMTFQEFAADELGWASYQKAKKHLGSQYLSEHG